MSFEPVDSAWARHPRAERLVALIQAALNVADPALVPAKLGLAPARWHAFLDHLAEAGELDAPSRSLLATVYGALRAVGASDAYWALMEGVRFPLEHAGARWARTLGATSAPHDAVDHALAKLRLERVGLHVRRRVAIAGATVDWAIAGVVPTGEVVRLAVVVRTASSPLAALREDLADDAVAAEGFELLAFRDWQLRYPGACALHVAEAVGRRVEGLRLPARLVEPEDAFVIQRIQAAPAMLTPRQASPNWATREALRAQHPHADFTRLLGLYEDTIVERTLASADGEEWTIWG
jgi:hypothetical protein